MLRKNFNFENLHNRLIINLFGLKIKIKKRNLASFIFEKPFLILISFLPEKPRYFIRQIFIKKDKWLYEIRYKNYSYNEIFKLFKARKLYPRNILTTEETINYVISNKCSIARIGDGEELLFNIIGTKCVFPELREKLIKIQEQGTNENCLVCINNFNADNEHCPEFYRKHFTHYFMNIADYLEKINFSKNIYGDAYAFLFWFEEKTKLYKKEKMDKIKQIWNNKKVLFVINNESKILKDKNYFNNTLAKEFLFIPSQNAYSKYDEILNQIKNNYDTSHLVYIEGGAMATVLAWELSELGYQALDMGGFYERIIYPIKNNG